MNEDIKKKVDENWKAQVAKDKKDAAEKNQTYHQANFTVFLSSLSMQAMIALGKLENPLSGKIEKNLEQAHFLIDTLGIIKDKTKGNLTSQEENFLEESLYNLRMIYVQEKNSNSKNTI